MFWRRLRILGRGERALLLFLYVLQQTKGSSWLSGVRSSLAFGVVGINYPLNLSKMKVPAGTKSAWTLGAHQIWLDSNCQSHTQNYFYA